MTYREADSTEPPTKIHKVLRAKSSKKKKKKRKSPPRRTLVGIPHEELGDGSGSIFGGEGDGGGGMGESYDPSIVEGLGNWALNRLFHHTGVAARGRDSGGMSGPQGSNSSWEYKTPWDTFKDTTAQGVDAIMGESVATSLLDYLHNEGIDLGIQGMIVPNKKSKKKDSSCGCKHELSEEMDNEEKKIGSYQTRYFYICPGAQTAFPKIEDKIGGEKAGELAKLADNIFGIEAAVLDAGEPNQKSTKRAKSIYKMLMDKASTYNVDDMLDFMMGHIEIIENPDKKDK
jgi:hypothetical protein